MQNAEAVIQDQSAAQIFKLIFKFSVDRGGILTCRDLRRFINTAGPVFTAAGAASFAADLLRQISVDLRFLCHWVTLHEPHIQIFLPILNSEKKFKYEIDLLFLNRLSL